MIMYKLFHFVESFLRSSLFLESLILEKFLFPAAIMQNSYSVYLAILSNFLAPDAKATFQH